MNFKEQKKVLEELFLTIQEAAKVGELPDLETVNKFSRLASRLSSMAEEDWKYEWDDLQHIAGQLLHSVKKNLVQDAIGLVESLNDAQTYCHKNFRD